MGSTSGDPLQCVAIPSKTALGSNVMKAIRRCLIGVIIPSRIMLLIIPMRNSRALAKRTSGTGLSLLVIWYGVLRMKLCEKRNGVRSVRLLVFESKKGVGCRVV